MTITFWLIQAQQFDHIFYDGYVNLQIRISHKVPLQFFWRGTFHISGKIL